MKMLSSVDDMTSNVAMVVKSAVFKTHRQAQILFFIPFFPFQSSISTTGSQVARVTPDVTPTPDKLNYYVALHEVLHNEIRPTEIHLLFLVYFSFGRILCLLYARNFLRHFSFESFIFSHFFSLQL